MAEFLTLYISTVAVFLFIDYFGLTYLIRPIFARTLGDGLLENFRAVPALAFYMFFMVGVTVFVSLPAYHSDIPLQALGMGVFLGALAYGTYEFTNLATLRDWTWEMVIVDFTWGSVLTGVASMAGVLITLAIF
ncbi:MAG: DUF2177 family protein [Marinovum sp.]|nr:DUF2177 family protein [Marinovum sp.]